MTAPTPSGPPLRHSRALTALGHTVFRLSGWAIDGELPAIPKFVAIVAPHTSNWDFVVGVFLMFSLDIRVHWLGKASLFRGPLGPWLRSIDGRPVHRETHEGVVDQAAALMREEPRIIMALAPEGTRTRVNAWRSGFYHIALQSRTPILPVALDWGRRRAVLGAPMQPTGNYEQDVHLLRACYSPTMARHRSGFWSTRIE